MIGLQNDLFPEPARAGYRLRPYQDVGSAAVTDALAKHRSTLVAWATALGKTVLFCEQAKLRGGCLVIAHRDSLIRQAAEKLQLAAGDEPVAIEKAQERAHFGARFIVGSVQTLKGERLRRFALRFPSIDFLVFDEAHRATAKSYRAIAAAYPNAKILYVTATPDRSDGVGMHTICESVAHEYSIVDATADGWLTPLRFVPVSSDLDLGSIRVTKQSDGEKDFDVKELDSAVVQEAGRIAGAAMKALAELGPDARGIGFTPGVKTAHACAAAMNEITPGIAGVVDGEMADAEKRPVMEAHREGRIRVVWNCNVLSEGHDDPTLTFVFDASPSRSRLRVAQRWGRATRLHSDALSRYATPAERRAAISASPKPWAVIFDLVSNSAEHDVIGPVDLLGGKDLPPDVAKRAKQIMREEGGKTDDAVERAKVEIESAKRRAIAAKRLAAATAVTLGKPRSVFDRVGVEFLRRKRIPGRPAERITASMWGLLRHRGIPIPPDCTIPIFKRLVTLDKKRELKGLCRLGGVEWLRVRGIDGWALTSEQAVRIRESIKAAGRKLTTQEIGDAIAREPGEEG